MFMIHCRKCGSEPMGGCGEERKLLAVSEGPPMLNSLVVGDALFMLTARRQSCVAYDQSHLLLQSNNVQYAKVGGKLNPRGALLSTSTSEGGA